MEREKFFQEACHKILNGLFTLIQDHPVVQKLEQFGEEKVRPPGSSPTEQEFQSLCTGCDACMKACPANAIYIDDLDRRYPLLYPQKQPCLHCTGYPCIQACPTGALKLVNDTELRQF